MPIGKINVMVKKLGTFLKTDYKSLSIPSVQREFVWDADDIEELLVSIINGYPIGSIIIWKSEKKFPAEPLCGTEINKKVNEYILDGQQRLTSLMLVMNNWTLTRGKKIIRTDQVNFTPETKKFNISQMRGINVSMIVKAALGDSDAIRDLNANYNDRIFKKALDECGSIIANYEVPFYILETTEEEEDDLMIYQKIAEIFTRVNSKGVRIGNLEMFLAFFAANFDKKTKDALISVHEKYDKYGLDLEPILRFVFSKMNISQNSITKPSSFKKAVLKIKNQFKDNQVMEIIDKADKAIQKTISLLDEEFGLDNSTYLPSQVALIPLFDFFYDFSADKKKELIESKKILLWFLISSFNGLFSNSTNKKITDVLNIIKNSKKSFPLDDLLKYMKDQIKVNTIVKSDIIENSFYDILKGRAGVEYQMLLIILLHRNEVSDWGGKTVRGSTIAFHHIFPKKVLNDNEIYDRDMINCIGNLSPISPSVNSNISDKEAIEYLEEYENVDLKGHFISTDKKLWDVKNFEKFLDKRLLEIWKSTDLLLQSLKPKK